MKRVVSLVPSVTETLLAWGVEPVGCTRFCEQPSLPAYGGTKDPDVAAIAALGPDLVVVDREENRREDADALVAAGCHVHVLCVRSVADVGEQLTGLAGAVGGDELAERWRAAWDAADVPTVPPEPRVRAFVPIWRRPWMAIGAQTYGSSLLASIGVANVVGEDEPPYAELDLEAAAARTPDVVLAPSEPYPFAERHVEELSAVAPVVLVDGQDLFWWGSRTAAARSRLAARLAPLVP